MYVRLAFSVNIMVSPEIMIVDEALAVGDMNFKAKCMTALTRIQEAGATVVFVSHDIGSIKSLCSRAIYLDHGNVIMAGKASDVAEHYVRVMREEMNQECSQVPIESSNQDQNNSIQSSDNSEMVFKRSEEFDARVAQFRYGTGGVKITFVELINMSDEPIQSVVFNQEVKIRVYIESSLKKNISIGFNICDDKKIILTGCGFPQVKQELLETEIGGQYLAEYTIRLPLEEGSYSLRGLVSSPVVLGETAEFLDVVEDAVVFRVERWGVARSWSKVHLFPGLKLNKIKTPVLQNDNYSENNIAFIIGTGRCGTTMLAQILNAHSKICVPHELQFIFEHSNNGERLYELFSSKRNLDWQAEDFIQMIASVCPYKFDEYFDYEGFFVAKNTPSEVLAFC